jgi:hypothetical protein
MSIKRAEAVKVGPKKKNLPLWRSEKVLEAMNARYSLSIKKGNWAALGSRRRKIYTELDAGGQRR